MPLITKQKDSFDLKKKAMDFSYNFRITIERTFRWTTFKGQWDTIPRLFLKPTKEKKQHNNE